MRAAQEDGGLDVQPPAPSLTPTVYGGDLLFFNLKGLATPDDAARAELLTAFADAVSLVESAEPLPAWGAAPEQRLALYFRRLPTVSEWSEACMSRGWPCGDVLGCRLGCLSSGQR